MFRKVLVAGLMLVVLVFTAAAQDDRVSISGDFQTIYTMGNADSIEQRIDTVPTTVGAFFDNPFTGSRKNGFYNAANIHITMRPTEWLEGYFKLYGVHRPGSFYMPLSMENMNTNNFAPSIDAIFGRANVFGALGLNLPVDLFLKAGRYKAQAAQYGIVSKYKTEQVLFMMNLKTDFTYEIEVVLNDPIKLSLFGAVNYLLNQSVQRYYDEDGAIGHGNAVINQYAPQFMAGIRLLDFSSDMLSVNAEMLYGMNVSNIYSGHAAGASVRANINITDSISVPVGLQFAFHEKNIDLLGQTAIAEDLIWPNATGTLTTMSFRESMGVALGTGVRFKNEFLNAEFNVAGSFNMIKHYYRTDLSIIKMSADAMVTLFNKFFVGGGVILGTLTEVEWKTRADATGKEPDHFQVFRPLENIGYEVYGGINLGNSSRFIVGFNNNKGLSLNNMLEARHEGQVKYKQKGTNWGQDQLAEAGGLYFKFFFRF
ncbi:MAG: hypothetical protein FWD26_01595 [Treponema sp.]|nr:hypothetical protein [Treponema sp.]